jgi:diguanylate cyclase (GGDEF)-like protein/PAS domain S-box-containing protein
VASVIFKPLSPRLLRGLRLLPWLILLLGCLLSWRNFDDMRHREREMTGARFELRASEMVLGLEQRIERNAEMLRGVAGLFASSQEVSRQEFHIYIERMQLSRYHPGLQGVGFAQRLWPAELARHVARVRADDHPGYEVLPRGEREVYSSIVYLEPLDWRNQRALGFDMFSEPIRQEAMRRAALTGEVAVSSRVTLVQEVDEHSQPGFLIYAPIYRKGQPTETPEQRWAALEGWAYSPVRSGDLIDAYLREQFRGISPAAVLRVYAGEQASEDQRLYGPPLMEEVGGAPPRVNRTLHFQGSSWRVVAEPPAGEWKAANAAGDAHAALWSGLASTALLAALVAVASRSHRQVSAALGEAMQANLRLAESEAALRLSGSVLNASHSAILVTDAQRQIVLVNPSFTRITGYAPEEVLGKVARVPSATTQDDAFCRQLWEDVEAQGLWEGELQGRRKNGEAFPAELSLSRVTAPEGSTIHYIGMFNDITARRRVEERVRFLAHHDYLTGLPNRALLVERARQELASARRYGRRPALMFLDLDHFKPINDTHGHEAGDAILRGVATRLHDELRESDLVCRQGGDEFVVLLPDHADRAGLEQLARKLLEAIERPYLVDHLQLHVSACIGVSTYPDNGETVDALIQSADSAMYQAKSHPEIKVRFAPAVMDS